MSTLFSWLGRTDIKAFENDDPMGAPIPSILQTGKFNRIVIISDWPKSDDDAAYEEIISQEDIAAWLKQHFAIEVHFIGATIKNPTDLSSVYQESLAAVNEQLLVELEPSAFNFNLSSGTWAMSVAWTLIAKTQFINAKCWASSQNEGPEEISIPFDISHEFYAEIEKQISQSKEELLAKIHIEKNNFYNSAVFTSQAMRKLYSETVRAAEHRYPVLITGELGTEKSVFAKEIHNHDATRSGEFIAVFCGSDTPFEVDQRLFGTKGDGRIKMMSDHRYGPNFVTQAKGGTLYLEDVDMLSNISQTSLLELIEETEREQLKNSYGKHEKPRLIATAKSNLIDAVANGRFSEQLYFKLSAVTLHIPSLHDRDSDILTIAEDMLSQVNKLRMQGAGYSQKSFSPGARNFIKQRKWPGNLFELETTIKRAALNSITELISEADMLAAAIPLPDNGTERVNILNQKLGDQFKLKDVLDEVARHYLERAQEQSNGNASAAYKLVGLSNYQTFLNWYNRYVVKQK